MTDPKVIDLEIARAEAREIARDIADEAAIERIAAELAELLVLVERHPWHAVPAHGTPYYDLEPDSSLSAWLLAGADAERIWRSLDLE